MPVRRTSPQVSQSRRSRRSDRRFFEALESCVGNPQLGPRPRHFYSSDSPTALVVRFGHLYPDKASKAARQLVESTVMSHLVEAYGIRLRALDPQRLGTATAAYDLHFKEQFLKDKLSLADKGEFPIDFIGQQKFLKTSLRSAQSAPMFAQIVVKQLDFRWTAKGATSALLAAAGYSQDVAVKTEFAGELPAHLSCWDSSTALHTIHLGRSDTIVAQVTAPASDPSLRKLPRSIQFQGHTISIAVSRSLHCKTEQRSAASPDALLKQQRRRARNARRRHRLQQKASSRPPSDSVVTVNESDDGLRAEEAGVDTSGASTSGREHAAQCDATPSAGKKRDLESGSDTEPAAAVDSDTLAIVPATPDDDRGGSVRRSSREHKKAKPYYESPSSSQPTSKARQGLRSGFLKRTFDCLPSWCEQFNCVDALEHYLLTSLPFSLLGALLHFAVFCVTAYSGIFHLV